MFNKPTLLTITVLLLLSLASPASGQNRGTIYFPTERGSVIKYKTYDEGGKMTGYETHTVTRTYSSADTLFIEYELRSYNKKFKVLDKKTQRIYQLGGQTWFDVDMMGDYDGGGKTRKRLAELKKMGAIVHLAALPAFNVNANWKPGDVVNEVAQEYNLNTGVPAVKLCFADRTVEGMEYYFLDNGKRIQCMKVSYVVRYELGNGLKEDIGRQVDLYAPGIGLVRREGYIDGGKKKIEHRLELSSVVLN